MCTSSERKSGDTSHYPPFFVPLSPSLVVPVDIAEVTFSIWAEKNEKEEKVLVSIIQARVIYEYKMMLHTHNKSLTSI